MLDLRRRRIDARKRAWSASAGDQLRERAGATADIEPAHIFRRIEPPQEFLADGAAPPSHEPLVGRGAIEDDIGLSHACAPGSMHALADCGMRRVSRAALAPDLAGRSRAQLRRSEAGNWRRSADRAPAPCGGLAVGATQ